MKTETDGALAAYQQRMAVAQEMSEAQSKFFHAALALRDPQGLAALHASFFSHPPKDIFKSQQQLLNTMTETQAKISDVLGKHMAQMKTEAKPLWAANKEGNTAGSAGSFYSVWSKVFQDTMELASLGMKTIPLAISNPSNRPAGKNEGSQAKQK